MDKLFSSTVLEPPLKPWFALPSWSFGLLIFDFPIRVEISIELLEILARYFILIEMAVTIRET